MNCDGCKESANLRDFRRLSCDDSHRSSLSFPNRTASERPRGSLTRSQRVGQNNGEDIASPDDRWDADVEPLWVDSNSSSSYWRDAPSNTEVKIFISSQDSDEHHENGGTMVKAGQWPEAEQRCSMLEQQQQQAGGTHALAGAAAVASAVVTHSRSGGAPGHANASASAAALPSRASESSLGTGSPTAASMSNGYDSDGSSTTSASAAAAANGSPLECSNSSSAGFSSTPPMSSGDLSYVTVRRLSSSSSAEGSTGLAPPPAYSSRKQQQQPPTGSAAAAVAASRRSDTAARDRRRTWFSGSYKQRSDEFRKIFKDVPPDEHLLVDYSCAMQKELLVHGRLYVSQNWICFYANIFRWETTVAIQLRDVSAITKERTAKFIPTLQISTAKERLVFTSFASRDKSYLMVFKAWQNAITGQLLSTQELNAWIRHLYGSWPDIASSDAEEVDAVLSASPIANALDAEAVVDQMGVVTKDDASPSGEAAVASERRGAAMVSSYSSDCVERLCGHTTATSIVHSASTGAALSAVAGQAGGQSMLLSRETAASEPSLLRSGLGGQQRPTGQRQGGTGGQSTDESDTTEDDAGAAESAAAAEEPESEAVLTMAVSCSWHQHTGRVMVDDEYSISAQELLTMLFSDSDFMKRFLSSRKTTDVVVAPWPAKPDGSGNKQRTNTYTIALNAPIGPKSTPATEIQTMYKECVPGTYYCIDCKCLNSPDLPYGENFYVLNKYCILRLGKNQSRLVVHSETVYIKSVFMMIRSIIDKNVSNGVTSYFVPLKQALREESDERKRTAPTVVPKKTVRRRRRANTPPGAAAAATVAPPGRKISVPTAGRSAYAIAANPEVSLLPVLPPPAVMSRHTELLTFAILLLLIAFNAFLFYKLWSLEASMLPACDASYDHLSYSNGCELSPQQLVHSMQQQRDAHSHEVERWQLLLEASKKYIDELKSTIESLKASLKVSDGSQGDSYQATT